MAGCFSGNYVSTGDLNRGSQGFAPCAFWFFLHNAKRIKPFPFREASRFCEPRISTPKHQLRTNKTKSFCRSAASPPPCGDDFPTFCKIQKVGQKTLKLSCLLETWSPCSRPFAILPVSAVSDAQKLATGNFLHVRAESLSLPGRHTPCAKKSGTFRILEKSRKTRLKAFYSTDKCPHSARLSCGNRPESHQAAQNRCVHKDALRACWRQLPR